MVRVIGPLRHSRPASLSVLWVNNGVKRLEGDMLVLLGRTL